MKPMANAPPLLDIIQSATEPIITVDAQQRIVMFNSAAERVFLQADRAIGASLDILIPARFRDIHARHVDRFRETGVSEENGLGSPLGPARQRGRISHGSVDLADAQRGGRVPLHLPARHH